MKLFVLDWIKIILYLSFDVLEGVRDFNRIFLCGDLNDQLRKIYHFVWMIYLFILLHFYYGLKCMAFPILILCLHPQNNVC